MDSNQSTEEAVLVPKSESKGKAVEDASRAPAPAIAATKKFTVVRRVGWKKGIAITDFVLRVCAASAAFAAAVAAGQAEQVLPFFTQFLQFHAQYDDLPVIPFFVIVTAAAGGYLVLSMPFSVICIVRPYKVGPRLLLLILDMVMTTVTISGAGAATAIMYLSHNGSADANWLAICQQFTDFCQQITGGLIASYVAILIFIALVIISAVALKKTTPLISTH